MLSDIVLTCANPQCARRFLKLHARQTTCSPACSRALARERKKRWKRSPKGKLSTQQSQRRRRAPKLTDF